MKKQPKIMAVGGVDEKDGKFIPFFELHSPCFGGQHGKCIVKRRDNGPPQDSLDAAAAFLTDVHREVGWESEHDA